MFPLKSRSLLAAVIVLLCLVTRSVAQNDEAADERIRSFDSHITLHPDGSMQVQETIEVQAAGIEIRHGIYRDFPTRYKDLMGNRYTVTFEIVGVQRDGQPEPYHTESLSNGVRVYFGDKGTLISSGVHRYVFTYNTNRQLGFFKDHDELYWNVTGLGWSFRIDAATATVLLPPQIHNFVTSLDAYTGAMGERGRGAAVSRDDDDNPHFAVEHLAPRNGITIVVTWPKGLIAEPTREQKIKWFLSDNRNAAVGLIGLLVVLGYYLVVWTKVGRDPAAGTVVPLYEPPDNMSPAAMRYLRQMNFDDKAFTSAILGLAAKGCLTIKQDGSHSYRLMQKRDSHQIGQLSSDEKTLKQKLFEDNDRVDLSSSGSSVVYRARQALETALHTGLEKLYFVTNAGYLWPGILLTIIAAVAMLLAGASQMDGGQLGVALFMIVWLSGWSVGVGALLHAVARAWKAARANKVLGGAGAMGITLFTIPFLIGEIAGLGALTWAISVVGLLVIVLLIGSNVLFHHLLKAPTRAGRQLLDRVDGFKMFLTAVDGPRFTTMIPPNKTPELFERFLPYALALGVEQAWAQQFSQVLATAAGASSGSGATYSPSWYSGAFIASTPAAFASSFSSGFSSVVSASSSPPGSSSGGGGFSGGGGGGSSGGGGGGGGGGGW
ncbi:MAG TPA: DUF2207 domain-containing protein [Candidatus Angelobacter sp.]|nr:DUF2207 domain-containing protein [Candidatus Angelobacter sp.]